MIITFLKEASLFQELEPADLEEVAVISSVQAYDKGEMVFLQGDNCRGFFIMAEGKVKIYRTSASGKEHILHIVHTGESFSEAAVFGGMPYPATAEAIENAKVIFVPKKEFMGLLEKRPQMAVKMLFSMSKWLKRMTDHIYSLTSQNIDERLANFIIGSFKRKNIEPKNGAKIEFEADKQVIAARLGTTPETLSRTFQKAKSEGIIAINKKEITILNVEMLYHLSSA